MTGLRPVKGFSAQTRHTAKKNLTSAWNHVWWTWPSGAFDSPGDPRLVPFVKSFQKKYRLPQTGYLDLATLNRMRAVRRAGVSDSDLIQKAIYFISGSRNQLLNQLRLYDPRVYSRYPTTQPGSWRNGRRTPQGLQRAREGMTGWGLTALFLSTQDRNSDVKMPTAVELRIIKNMARTSQRTATRDHLNIAAASRSPGTPQRAAPSAGRARQGVLLRLATKLRQKASVQADALRRIQERAPGPAQGALGRAEEAARRAAAAAEAAAAAAAAGGSGMTAAEVRALMDQLLAQFRAEMAAASAAAAGMPPQYQDAVAAQSGGSLREGEEIPTAVANLSAAAGDTSVAASIAAGTAAIEAAEATAAAAREEAASWVEGGVDAGEALEASEEWTDEMVAQAEAAAAAAAAQADGGFKLTPIKLAIGGALVWWLFLRKK
jgi:peptidoglycan hydrolase-like protein with peptidoglycan-binding domain